VISLCQQRQRSEECIKFLMLIDVATPPGKDLYLIADNYSADKHSKVGWWINRPFSRSLHADEFIVAK
jgi:hypothetical protein